jgi:hypothetical protein
MRAKIKRNVEEVCRVPQSFANSFPYHTRFVNSHREEWNQYVNLIGIPDVVGGTLS